MERDFYRRRLETHDLQVVVPDRQDRELVHRAIYDELVHGKVLDTSRDHYVDIIQRMSGRGAEGIISGCTEIELLVQPRRHRHPLLPTTRLQTVAAFDWILDS